MSDRQEIRSQPNPRGGSPADRHDDPQHEIDRLKERVGRLERALDERDDRIAELEESAAVAREAREAAFSTLVGDLDHALCIALMPFCVRVQIEELERWL